MPGVRQRHLPEARTRGRRRHRRARRARLARTRMTSLPPLPPSLVARTCTQQHRPPITSTFALKYTTENRRAIGITSH
uniref:Uncharacterized protein n=1 Tax=Pararge aegeria TaxID=116150 RepID=S4PFA5_9NEOP